MRKLTGALIILSLVLVTPQLAVASGGSSSGGSSGSLPEGPEMTPEQKALEFYQQGLRLACGVIEQFLQV